MDVFDDDEVEFDEEIGSNPKRLGNESANAEDDGEIGGVTGPPPLTLLLLLLDEMDDGEGEAEEECSLWSEWSSLLFRMSFTERTFGLRSLSIPNLISDGFTPHFLEMIGCLGLGLRTLPPPSLWEERSVEETLLLMMLGLLLLLFVEERDDGGSVEADRSDLGEERIDDVIDEEDDEEVDGGEHKATWPKDVGSKGSRSFHAFKC